MLATLIEPDGGDGHDRRRRPAQATRARCAGGSATWPRAAAPGTSRPRARSWSCRPGCTASARPRRSGGPVEALDAFQLTEYADRKCKTYSGGQRRRVDIALGIIHEPKIVFLDEPTTGLDPQRRAHMWDEVRRLRDEGMTVFLTTHYLDEADALCDRISIMDDGEIVAEGTPEELKREISGDVVTVGVNGSAPSRRRGAAAGRAATCTASRPSTTALRLYVDDGATAIPHDPARARRRRHRRCARSSCTGRASTTCS